MRYLVAIIAAGVSLAGAGTATAQTVSDAIRASLRDGQRVTVTVNTGQEVKGRVTDLSTDAMVIREGGDHVTVPYADIVRIEEQRDSLSNGILIGLGVGAGVAGWRYSEDARAPPRCGVFAPRICPPDLTGYLMLGAGLGTAIGVVADALIYRRDRTVFGRPRTARVNVSPHIQPGVQGVVISVAW
jgi:hypothetical protein